MDQDRPLGVYVVVGRTGLVLVLGFWRRCILYSAGLLDGKGSLGRVQGDWILLAWSVACAEGWEGGLVGARVLSREGRKEGSMLRVGALGG